jgi:hypothetical protein
MLFNETPEPLAMGLSFVCREWHILSLDRDGVWTAGHVIITPLHNEEIITSLLQQIVDFVLLTALVFDADLFTKFGTGSEDADHEYIRTWKKFEGINEIHFLCHFPILTTNSQSKLR